MPQLIDLADLPTERRGRLQQPYRFWRDTCAGIPEGQALELTDIIPDGMAASRFVSGYATPARRHGCYLRRIGIRVFLARRGVEIVPRA